MFVNSSLCSKEITRNRGHPGVLLHLASYCKSVFEWSQDKWNGSDSFIERALYRDFTNTYSNVPSRMAFNPSSSKQTRGNQKQSSAKNNQNICRAATPRQRGYQAHPDSAKQMVCLRHHSHTHILLRHTHSHLHPHIRAGVRRLAWECLAADPPPRKRKVCLRVCVCV